MAQELPGKGFLGWLGRQVGHIRKAVRSDPRQKVVHRRAHTEEARLPDQPDVKLRRTVIDEVIVTEPNDAQQKGRP